MARRHDRGRFGPAYTVFVLARSAYAATREPAPAPRHARRDIW